MATNLPIKKFRSGSIETALWLNKRDIDGATVEFKTVGLTRSYKKKGEDLWRTEKINLRRNDLQKAILVLQKMQEQLLLEEKHKTHSDENEEDE